MGVGAALVEQQVLLFVGRAEHSVAMMKSSIVKSRFERMCPVEKREKEVVSRVGMKVDADRMKVCYRCPY